MFAAPSYDSAPSPDLLKSQPLSELLPEDPGQTLDSDVIIIIQNVLTTAVSSP